MLLQTDMLQKESSGAPEMILKETCFRLVGGSNVICRGVELGTPEEQTSKWFALKSNPDLQTATLMR